MTYSPERPLRVGIVGAGPSGLFAADALLKQDLPVAVDLFDRLPTPFGLVRYGVAPDHQKIKSVTKLYQKTLDDPRVRFFGHVSYGQRFNAGRITAVLRRDFLHCRRTLRPGLSGFPARGLPGSLSATEFVAWYNGHPDFADLNPDLAVKSVAVIGMGNVAVDVTRILAKTADELRVTDIADHAVAALQTQPDYGHLYARAARPRARQVYDQRTP